MKKKKTSIWKMVFGLLFLIGISVAGYSGWKWLSEVTLVDVQMQGLVHASEDEVRDLIRVDSGAVMFDLDSAILADRIRRHPWIMEARVSRLPTGTLDIRVVERHPVAMALESNGRLGFYLDRNGYRMPLSEEKWYPVPIISGELEPYRPVPPIQDRVLGEMLYTLPVISQQSDALLSELRRVDTGFELRTTPAGKHGSIPVLLGDTEFASKFQLLEAFWEQEVLRHQDIVYASIDLRFNSQVVTKQGPRPPASAISN
jgi:cell division protein FtsQ